jgi:hypothetical protein
MAPEAMVQENAIGELRPPPPTVNGMGDAHRVDRSKGHNTGRDRNTTHADLLGRRGGELGAANAAKRKCAKGSANCLEDHFQGDTPESVVRVLETDLGGGRLVTVRSLIHESDLSPFTQPRLDQRVERRKIGRHQRGLIVREGSHDVNVGHALVVTEQFVAGERRLPRLELILGDRPGLTHLRVMDGLVGAELRVDLGLLLAGRQRGGSAADKTRDRAVLSGQCGLLNHAGVNDAGAVCGRIAEDRATGGCLTSEHSLPLLQRTCPN